MAPGGSLVAGGSSPLATSNIGAATKENNMENGNERGSRSYAANALKNQPQFWIDEINAARRAKGLAVVNMIGRSWEECTDAEKRNIEKAKIEKRLQSARDDARLVELERELKRLKAELAAGRES